MTDWNEQAVPNNNLPSKTIRSSKLVSKQGERSFSEELSDGGERDQMIQNTLKNKK